MMQAPLFKAHLQALSPEADYIASMVKTIQQNQWDQLFNKKTALEVDRLMNTIQNSEKGLKQSIYSAHKEAHIKTIYGETKQALDDYLIKAHLEQHLPEQYARLQESFHKISQSKTGQKLEREAKKSAEECMQARSKAVKNYLEASDPLQKRKELKAIYQVIRRAYKEPLVKLHLKEQHPEQYRKFEQNLNVTINEGLHTKFNKEIRLEQLAKDREIWQIER